MKKYGSNLLLEQVIRSTMKKIGDKESIMEEIGIDEIFPPVILELTDWNATFDTKNKTVKLHKYKGQENHIVLYDSYNVNGTEYATLFEPNGLICTDDRKLLTYTITIQDNVKLIGTSINALFKGMINLGSIKFGTGFDTSNITDMKDVFHTCKSLSKLDLTAWNTSNVTTMQNMFFACNSLTELNISTWDTSKVTNMGSMLQNLTSLTKLDVSKFDTSNVEEFGFMFSGLIVDSLDISNFNTGKAKSIRSMFGNMSNIKELNLRSFDTSNVTDMRDLLYNSQNLTVVDMTSFDISNITHTVSSNLILGTDRSKIHVYVNTLWDFNKTEFINDAVYCVHEGLPEDLSYIINETNIIVSHYIGDSTEIKIYGAYRDTETDVIYHTKFNKNIEYISFDANGDNSIIESFEVVGSIDGRDLISMNGMFLNNHNLKRVNFGPYFNRDVQYWLNNVVWLHKTFYGCDSLTDLKNLNGLIHSLNVSGMFKMFENCSSLVHVDMYDIIDTAASLENVQEMFVNCVSLTTVDCSTVPVLNDTLKDGMFRNCPSLETVDLRNWAMNDPSNILDMFRNCPNLKQVIVNKNMWKECTDEELQTYSVFMDSPITNFTYVDEPIPVVENETKAMDSAAV